MTADRDGTGVSARADDILRAGERKRVTLLRFIGGVVSMTVGTLLLKAAAVRLVRGVAALFAAAVALVWGLSLLGGGGWALVRRWRRQRRREHEESGNFD